MFQSDGCALPAFKFWSELDHQHQRRLPTRSTTRTMVVSRSSPQHVSRSRSCPQSSNLKRSSCCVLASHRVALRASSLSSTVPVLTTRRKHSMANSEDFWSTCRLSRHRFSSRVTSTHGSTGRTCQRLAVVVRCHTARQSADAHSGWHPRRRHHWRRLPTNVRRRRRPRSVRSQSSSLAV